MKDAKNILKMSNKLYDILKWVALVALPAIEVFWLTLGNIWGFPLVVEIGSTIAAVDVLLGSLLGVSNVKYKKAGQEQALNEDLLKDMEGYFDKEVNVEKELEEEEEQ